MSLEHVYSEIIVGGTSRAPGACNLINFIRRTEHASFFILHTLCPTALRERLLYAPMTKWMIAHIYEAHAIQFNSRANISR